MHQRQRWLHVPHPNIGADSMMPTIGWVEPAKPIRRLDHLGVQVPGIVLYAQLLPDITNVTDRARYYSFHPWPIRSFKLLIRNYSGQWLTGFTG